MDKELKLYEINADESEVFAVSCVDYPAVESNFIFMNKQEKQPQYINLESNEKRMVYGCALRSDFPIYRRHGDDEFYIQFTSNCIEKLSKKFMKNGFQFNWTTDHQDFADGLTVVESWLKVDMEKDKSIALGLDKDLALGSWFIGCSVDNDEVWQSIKEGKWKGFSIEAMVVMDEINFKKQNTDMTEQIELNSTFWEKLSSIIKEALNINSEAKSDDLSDVKEETVEMSAEEEKVEEIALEEATEEVTEPTEEEVAEIIAEQVVEEVESVVETEEEKESELQAIIDKLQDEINNKDAEIAEMKKQIEKMSKQPSTEPIKVDASAQRQQVGILDILKWKY